MTACREADAVIPDAMLASLQTSSSLYGFAWYDHACRMKEYVWQSHKTFYKFLRDMQVTMLNLRLLLLVPPHLLLLHRLASGDFQCAASPSHTSSQDLDSLLPGQLYEA